MGKFRKLGTALVLAVGVGGGLIASSIDVQVAGWNAATCRNLARAIASLTAQGPEFAELVANLQATYDANCR